MPSFFKTLVPVIFVVSTIAHAAPQNYAVSDIAREKTSKTSFDTMVSKYKLPKWVVQGGTESPAQQITFSGTVFYVASACKPHDCGSERIAIMYSPSTNAMYGVFLKVGSNPSKENLTWLNIGGSEESIDGKTILYAKLTGSLDNHPKSFNYESN